MGDVARTSLTNEVLLYKLFGVNAELLIDHAWGFEPCTMEDVKAYRPSSESISSGQVLSEPYSFDKARLILREMCDMFALELTSRGVIARTVTVTVGYDRESLADNIGYVGEVVLDFYGREVPRHAHGTERLRHYTSSCSEISAAALSVFERVVDPRLLVRRITLSASDILPESDRTVAESARQIDIFDDLEKELLEEGEREREYKRELRRQNAVLSIKKKFGKNAILKGMNFEEGATTIDRNLQIGGHKA
jgi:DNA polymerase V